MLFRRTMIASLAALPLLAAAMPGLAADGITVTDAWARFIPGARNGAVYLTIENKGATPDHLTGAEVKGAMVEIHESKMAADGSMSMGPLPDGVELPPNTPVSLAPGGMHMMVMGLDPAPKVGDKLAVTLKLKSGDRTIEVPVEKR